MDINNSLRYDKIEYTIGKLCRRIEERFPGSGLGQTCDDFFQFTKTSKKNIAWIVRPILWIRATAYVIIAATSILLIYSFTLIDFKVKNTFAEWATIAEASFNDIILIGAAFFFLFTLENRIKRRRALKVLNEIRGFAHVVDMHQLTKDPQLVGTERKDTENSPKSRSVRSSTWRPLTTDSGAGPQTFLVLR